MSRTLVLTLLFCLTNVPLSSQHLPGGSYQTTRERTYDLLHLRADLSVDWEDRSISGDAVLRLIPLISTDSVSVDAYGFRVSAVTVSGIPEAPVYSVSDRSILIRFRQRLSRTDTIDIRIAYEVTPSAGLYFIDPSQGTSGRPAIFTYGEGGINANWLPLYNAPNDKFTSEIVVTVARPYVAISNGSLVSTTEHADGSRTFHWLESLPHPDYLLALFVGQYTSVALRPAFGTIPLSVWVHPGQEDEARHVFARTPEMVEWFSERFAYRYPWEKYDQVSAFDYAIGAMENTTVTGHNNKVLRSGVFEEFSPSFTTFTSNWTSESIISHELAHHWFGDLVTYRDLSQLWLNESFASYLMMLWDEHRLGEDALRVHTTVALTDYLRYVSTEHIIRPLEYHSFDTREQIYNTETTYQKGAIVLNMLRWVLGDDAFFEGLGYYLKKHEYGNVDSHDLAVALGERTGRNLEWFFQDWVWGAGHPVFEISSTYLRDRKRVDLTVRQVQPFVKGQDLFTLPVEIRIDAGGTVSRHVVQIDAATEHFQFDAPSDPDMISFDGRGYLVAEIRFPKGFDELVYQITHDDIPGKIRALRNLAGQYASDPRTAAFLSKLFQGSYHWYVKAEAALLLAAARTPAAEQILIDQLKSTEYHVRKAAVIALGSYITGPSRTALRTVVRTDPVDDVAAAAIVSLAKTDQALGLDYLQRQASQGSWYGVRTLAALTAAQHLGDPAFVPLARQYVSTSYNYAIRAQALKTWAACDPLDTDLRTEVLPSAAENDILDVRTTAMALLGTLKVREALPVLQTIAETNGDGDIRFAAKEAIEQIGR